MKSSGEETALKGEGHQTEAKRRSCREGSEKADVLGHSLALYLLDNVSSVSLETWFLVLPPSNFVFLGFSCPTLWLLLTPSFSQETTWPLQESVLSRWNYHVA